MGCLALINSDGLRRDDKMGSDGWPALDTNSLTNGMDSRV